MFRDFRSAFSFARLFRNTLGVGHMASNATGKGMLFYDSSYNKEAFALAADAIFAVGFKPYYVGLIRYGS